MKVSVATIHTSRLNCTSKCLNHLYETKGVDYHIYLLIQGPQDRSKDAYFSLLEADERVTIIKNEKNIGGWQGRPQIVSLAAKSDCDYVLVIDNDVYVPPNWAKDMINTFERSPINTAGVGMMLDYGGKIYGGFDFGVDENLVMYYRSIKPPYRKDLVCDAAIDGAWMFPKSYRWMFYTTTPRIPSPFFGYDNMLSIRRRGFKFIVSKNVLGKHMSKQTGSYTKLRYGQSGEEVKESYRRFMRKWGIRVSRRLWLKIMFPRRFPMLWGFLREVRALS